MKKGKGVLIVAAFITLLPLIGLFLPFTQINGVIFRSYDDAMLKYYLIGAFAIGLLNCIKYLIWGLVDYEKIERCWFYIEIASYIVNGLALTYAITMMFMVDDLAKEMAFDVRRIIGTEAAIEWVKMGSAVLTVIEISIFIILNIIYAINKDASNVGIMTLKQKIAQVGIQIALIPVSALITAMTFSFFLTWVPYVVIREVWMKKVKSQLVTGYRWNEGESNYTCTETVSHDIRDKYGNKIGEFDTKERRAHYDDGSRFWGIDTDDLSLIWKYAIFALPLRIASVVLSIFACILKNICVSVRCPKIDVTKPGNRYNEDVFFYTDMVVF